MRALIAVAVVVMGCGLPGAQPTGSSCTDEIAECFNDSRISMCESGKWADYACPSSCSNNQPVRCDWTQAKVGQPCPKSFEGDGTLAGGGVGCTDDGASLLGCHDGKFVAVRCPSCRKSGGGWTCG